jgi:hypothetical protein
MRRNRVSSSRTVRTPDARRSGIHQVSAYRVRVRGQTRHRRASRPRPGDGWCRAASARPPPARRGAQWDPDGACPERRTNQSQHSTPCVDRSTRFTWLVHGILRSRCLAASCSMAWESSHFGRFGLKLLEQLSLADAHDAALAETCERTRAEPRLQRACADAEQLGSLAPCAGSRGSAR